MIRSPKQASILLVGIILLALFFWLGSRYPQLAEKANDAGHVSLSSLVTLNPHFALADDANLFTQLVTTTANWLWTNRIGMSFGLLFASLSLTFVHTIQRPKTRNGALNSFYGMIMGAPLGICTNCATPVARGLISGGETLETSLAVLVSSPSFNAIVVGMTFALFPLQMALLKYALVLVMVLVVIPFLIARLPDSIRYGSTVCELPNDNQQPTEVCKLPSVDEHHFNIGAPHQHESWGQASKLAMINVLSNLWMLIKLTVPLMILAGFLAAVGVHLLPLDTWFNTNAPVNIVSILGTALFAVMMPMPMAFDVIVSQALYSNGLSPILVMPLLTGLGMISIFPILVIATSVSKRLALGLFTASMALVLISAGLIALIGAPMY